MNRTLRGGRGREGHGICLGSAGRRYRKTGSVAGVGGVLQVELREAWSTRPRCGMMVSFSAAHLSAEPSRESGIGGFGG